MQKLYIVCPPVDVVEVVEVVVVVVVVVVEVVVEVIIIIQLNASMPISAHPMLVNPVLPSWETAPARRNLAKHPPSRNRPIQFWVENKILEKVEVPPQIFPPPPPVLKPNSTPILVPSHLEHLLHGHSAAS